MSGSEARLERALLLSSYDKYAEDGTQAVFTCADLRLTPPRVWPETREERIERLVQSGSLDRDCRGCQEFLAHPTLTPFAPRHRALASCRSGGRPHCTCDSCF